MTQTSPSTATPAPARLPQWLLRPWLGVLSRSVAAIGGGYALASTTCLLMALALPLPRSQAVLIGMMSGIVVCACAALWAFAVRSAWKAWAGIALPALLMYAVAALLQRGAA